MSEEKETLNISLFSIPIFDMNFDEISACVKSGLEKGLLITWFGFDNLIWFWSSLNMGKGSA